MLLHVVQLPLQTALVGTSVVDIDIVQQVYKDVVYDVWSIHIDSSFRVIVKISQKFEISKNGKNIQ